jgi:hypothetical protein
MWVDDDVGLDTRLREGHIDHRPFLRTYTLLAMSRGEFIADDGGARDAEFDANFLAWVSAFDGADEAHFFDESYFVFFVFEKVGLAIAVDVIICCWVVGNRMPCGKDVSRADLCTDVWQAVIIQRASPSGFDEAARREAEQGSERLARRFCFALPFLKVTDLGLVDRTVPKTPLMCGFVQDHSVVHVVTCIRDDSHDSIGAIGKVVQAILVVEWRSHDRRLTSL